MSDVGQMHNLYKAVLANPADNITRGAIADWFEENGGVAWPELIRAQIAILQHEPETPAHDAITATIKSVMKAAVEEFDRFAIPNPSWIGLGKKWENLTLRPASRHREQRGYILDRGFVGSIFLTPTDLVEADCRPAACFPLNGITLIDTQPQVIESDGEQFHCWAGDYSRLLDDEQPPPDLVIPHQLFCRLPDESVEGIGWSELFEAGPMMACGWKSHEQAMDALDLAALRFVFGFDSGRKYHADRRMWGTPEEERENKRRAREDERAKEAEERERLGDDPFNQ